MVKTRFQPTKKKNKFIVRRGKNAKGLTKKERAEVSKIAKATISNEAEDKYMNAQRHTGVVPVESTLGGTRVSVIGFSSSLANTTNQGQLYYGYSGNNSLEPIKEQKMLRPFVPATGDAQTDNYALEGRECKPKSAQCKWRFSRNISQMLTAQISSGYLTQNENAPLNLAQNLPIICRMVQVVPKQTQTNVLCDPKEDLFLDNYNNSTGIDVGTFDDTEMLTYRINKRRYNLVADKFFRIQNGLTVQWQRVAAPTGQTGLQPIISNTNANCEKIITTYPQLTIKKHGSIFYDTPATSQLEAPSSGHKRTFTLLHFIYAGAESFFDAEATAFPIYPTDIKISASPICKFTDV